MIRVEGIGGVFLYANDARALSEWYTHHFGLEFLFSAEEQLYYLEFIHRADADPGRRESTVFAIMPAKAPLGTERRECMINYRVPDLDGFLAQLQAAGIRVERREDYSYGRFAYIADPEGHPIELYQPLEPSGA